MTAGSRNFRWSLFQQPFIVMALGAGRLLVMAFVRLKVEALIVHRQWREAHKELDRTSGI